MSPDHSREFYVDATLHSLLDTVAKRCRGVLLSILAASLIMAGSGCGSTGYKGGEIVSLSASSITIDSGQSFAVESKLSGSPNVTWTLNGASCTGSGCGTTSSGSSAGVTYNAPATVTAPIQVILTADVAGIANQQTVHITVNPAPVISGTLPSGTVGMAYSKTIQVTGGTQPVRLSLASGALPAGLNFNATTGIIFGIPAASGSSAITVQSTDSSDVPDTTQVAETITIGAAGDASGLKVTGMTPTGTFGSPYSFTFAVQDSTAPFTWSKSAGDLPPGLSLDASAGTISGTPTGTGSFSFTLQVKDANGASGTGDFTIMIVGGNGSSGSNLTLSAPAAGVTGAAYTGNIGVSGGAAPYNCVITGLPAGVAANGCKLSGTPTVAGVAVLTVTATDSSTPANETTSTLMLTIGAGGNNSLALMAPLTGTAGTPYSGSVGVTGGTAPYTCMITGLPAGLSSQNCSITGTPISAGSSVLTVTATDAGNPALVFTGMVTLTIGGSGGSTASLTLAPPAVATAGTLYNAMVGVSGGVAPYTCMIAGLPAGLSSNSCTISGTPLTAATATLTVTATDSSSPKFTTTGTLALTIDQASGTDNFTITPSVSSLTIYPGSTQTVSVVTTGRGIMPITIGLSGVPSGITVTSSPATVLPGASAVLTLTAAPNADAEAFFPNADWLVNTATSNLMAYASAAGSTTVSAPLALTVSLSNTGFAPAAGQINLPVLKIDTGNVPVTSKDVDVSGTITLTSADGSATLIPGSSSMDNSATFHVHGNTTSIMPKLPYAMKLGTSIDLLSQLGVVCPYVTGSGKAICDKSKSYILLANYDDKSLLRDWSASALANAIPYGDGTNGYLQEAAGSPTPSGTNVLMPWAPHSAFVELYLNGQYEGNYQLIEKVNVDSHRLNIPELTEQDTSGDLSGGYLMEIDAHRDEAFVFSTPLGLPVGLIDPDFSPDPEVGTQTVYITHAVSTAENALFGANYTDPLQGWRAYFDEAALVNYYIVTDLMGNVDGGAFYSSVYLYKTVDNPLLYMGPAWDFDISAGNVYYQPIVSPDVPWTQVESPWYKRLFTDPQFAADVKNQWNTLKNNGVFRTWVASISQQSSALAQSAQNNFTRWPMVGETVWPNASAQDSYPNSVLALTDWLNERIGYLDAVLNGQAQSTVAVTSGPTIAIKGTPVAYTVHVSGKDGSPTGSVTLLLAGQDAGSALLDSAGNAQITSTAPVSGDLHPLAVYSGDTKFAVAQASVHTPSH